MNPHRYGTTSLAAAAAAASLCYNSQLVYATYEPVINSFGQPSYGVDITFPMHRHQVSTNYAWLPHNVDPENNPVVPDEYKDMPVTPFAGKQELYDDLIQGCRDMYGKKKGQACDDTEEDRIDMNLRQPQSMQNYTELGFKKIKAPEAVYKLVREFWDKNKDKKGDEHWFTGNTYINHWEKPSVMVNLGEPKLRGGGEKLKDAIWDAAKTTLEEWTDQELTPCSLYGIRVYGEGAVLSTHVDRLPLVSSAILNVDQDVDEPWPIEVYGHDGLAYNVTMEPGEMVLYESHSVLHGRPFPLVGRYYANVFIHFEPTGYSQLHGVSTPEEKDLDEQYKTSVERKTGGHESVLPEQPGLPPYIIPGTPEEDNWRMEHPNGWHNDEDEDEEEEGEEEEYPEEYEEGDYEEEDYEEGYDYDEEYNEEEEQEYDEHRHHRQRRQHKHRRHHHHDPKFQTGSTLAHRAAMYGKVEELREIAETKGAEELHVKDSNGWAPLHEGVRGGYEDVVEFLVDNGADVNERTNNGEGWSPLRIAIMEHGPDSYFTSFLKTLGAQDIGPEL